MRAHSCVDSGGDPVDADQVDAVMLAMRVLVAVTAQSVAQLDERVTLPQLRVLVVIASRGPQNLAAVAQGLGVHSSNATRACDKLVEAGLLDRSDDPADRRNLILRLTASGEELVETMNKARRASIAGILERVPVHRREHLTAALLEFVDAADGIPTSGAWTLGLTTESPISDGARGPAS
jgi:DNA-binding MarR family transcriptional regulator